MLVVDPAPLAPTRVHRAFGTPGSVPVQRGGGGSPGDPGGAAVVWLALTRLELLAGLRPAAGTAAVLDALGAADLAGPARRLRAAAARGPGSLASHDVVTVSSEVLAAASDPDTVTRWGARAGAAAARLHASAAGRRRPDPSSRELLRVLGHLERGARERPDDVATVLPLVMNHLVVPPATAVAVACSARAVPLAGSALRVGDDTALVDAAVLATPTWLPEAVGSVIGPPAPLRALRRDGTAVVQGLGSASEIVLLGPGASIWADGGGAHRLWTLHAAVSVATRRRVVLVPPGRSASWEGENAALRVAGPGTAVLVRPAAAATSTRPARSDFAAVS